MKKKTLLAFLLFIILYFQKSSQAWATDYYVATSGNDSYSGTSSQPWRTIQRAADMAMAGDTVYIRGGIYYERVGFPNSGTASQYITFRNYGTETATIDGSTHFSGTEKWEQYSGNIYRTKASFPVDWPAKMLYQDGTKLINWKAPWDPISGPGAIGEGEWWLDTANNRAYAWVYGGGNPGNHEIRITKLPSQEPCDWYGLLDFGYGSNNYIRIQGLNLQYSNSHAIKADGSSGLEILNVNMKHAYSSLIKFENTIDCVIDHVKGDDSGFAYLKETYGAEAIRIWAGSGVRISNCEVLHSYNMGAILFGGHESGVIENCVFHDSWGDYYWDPSIYLEATSYSTVRNNLIYNTHHGISLGHELTYFSVRQNTVVNNICYNAKSGCLQLKTFSSEVETTNNLIAHNTFIKAGSSGNVPEVWIKGNSYSNKIENNIVMAMADSQTGELVRIEDQGKNNTINYNNYYADGSAFWQVLGTTIRDFAQYQSTMNLQEAHSIYGNPRFVDLANRNLHLEVDSVAIDAGIDVGITDDFDGNPRPQGAGYDIGAYEYSEGGYSLSFSQGWNEIVWPADSGVYTAQTALEDIDTDCGSGTGLVIARKEQNWWEEYVVGYGGEDFGLDTEKVYYVNASKECNWYP